MSDRSDSAQPHRPDRGDESAEPNLINPTGDNASWAPMTDEELEAAIQHDLEILLGRDWALVDPDDDRAAFEDQPDDPFTRLADASDHVARSRRDRRERRQSRNRRDDDGDEGLTWAARTDDDNRAWWERPDEAAMLPPAANWRPGSFVASILPAERRAVLLGVRGRVTSGGSAIDPDQAWPPIGRGRDPFALFGLRDEPTTMDDDLSDLIASWPDLTDDTDPTQRDRRKKRKGRKGRRPLEE